jgi:HEAT repeat protein
MRALRLMCGACCVFAFLIGQSTAQGLDRSVHYERLTLFQMIARADIVAHVRVKDGEQRLALVDVVTPLKGELPAPQLRIDFRDLNLSPQGQGMVVFRDGEEYVLFLERLQFRKPSEKKANILELFQGRRGRMLLPAEGNEVTLGAIRSLVPLAQAGPEAQIEGLRGLLSSQNALLLEAALEELARLRAATPDDLPALLKMLGDLSPRIRSGALPLIASLFSGLGRTGTERTPDERAALALVLERARSDDDVAVRTESVRTLATWPVRDEVVGDLKAISKQDPSQTVRYEAERILFRMGT